MPTRKPSVFQPRSRTVSSPQERAPKVSAQIWSARANYAVARDGRYESLSEQQLDIGLFFLAFVPASAVLSAGVVTIFLLRLLALKLVRPLAPLLSKAQKHYEPVLDRIFLPEELREELAKLEQQKEDKAKESSRGGGKEKARKKNASERGSGLADRADPLLREAILLALQHGAPRLAWPDLRLNRTPFRHHRWRSAVRKPVSASELEAAFEQAQGRGKLEQKLHFGSLLAEISAEIDDWFIFDDLHEIIGRCSGLRGWFEANCPNLLSHYSTALKYKNLADKMQWCCGLWDPCPLDIALPSYGFEPKDLPQLTPEFLQTHTRILDPSYVTTGALAERIPLARKFASALLARPEATTNGGFNALLCACLGIEKRHKNARAERKLAS